MTISAHRMLNVMSVDVEDYFQVEALSESLAGRSWDSFEPRVEGNVARILDLFGAEGIKGTFFVLGWVAQRFPQLIKRIAAAGHEIGCHGFAHRRLHRLSPEEFRADLRDARELLKQLAQQPVIAYRAPSFSIVRQTDWALDVLAEEGFRFDSSIFPVRHDLYGIPDADRFPHWHTTPRGRSIFEFPPSTIRRGRQNLGIGGGGYLRIFPYRLTRWALRRINEHEKQPAMVYFHPWEIDPGQPRIRTGLRSRLRHYTNLSGMEGRIGRLLRDFRFGTLSEVCGGLEAFRSKSG